jgi:hypothetical protein
MRKILAASVFVFVFGVFILSHFFPILTVFVVVFGAAALVLSGREWWKIVSQIRSRR